ncbi:hypothetical protein EYF80_049268 [Liparis tanakae]|uniref:Uncharacterized protein n=1 Tax=Liparis tanakae TaxID=230148 RepID=A0A4Z2FH48_9TELE|nr:hypothetical protein EYF80_049268 [Liparis tanakae]
MKEMIPVFTETRHGVKPRPSRSVSTLMARTRRTLENSQKQLQSCSSIKPRASADSNTNIRSTMFFQQDEEMLILTHSDELNTTYGEDSRLPFANIADRNKTSSDDTGRNRSSLPESTSTLPQESPALKETRATVISTGPRTITITSAVSTADSVWFNNTNGHGEGRRSSETEADGVGSSREQNQGNKTGSGRTQEQRLSEDGEEDGTSHFCTSFDEERRMRRMSLVKPDQSPDAGCRSVNPTPSITAWEAGWNVTNAIQPDLGGSTTLRLLLESELQDFLVTRMDRIPRGTDEKH